MEEFVQMSGSAPTNQMNQMDSGSEPIVIATNATVKLDSASSYEQTEAGVGPLAVGTNLTIEITDSNGLLERLGIAADGSNNYLGTNITAGDDSNWMERKDQNPMYGGEPPSINGEPLLVGTNITFKIVSDDDASPSRGEASTPSSSTSGGNSGPLVVGTNQTLELTDDGTLFERSRITEFGSNDYLGNNISTFGDDDWMTRSDDTPSMGGIPMGNMGNTPNNDSSYQWDLGSAGNSTDGGSDLDQLFQASPWGSLSEVGVTSFEQVFPNVPSDIESNNPLAGGGAPSFGGMGGGAAM